MPFRMRVQEQGIKQTSTFDQGELPCMADRALRAQDIVHINQSTCLVLQCARTSQQVNQQVGVIIRR